MKIHNLPLKFKFYVLMTSSQPLTLFMHSEGLVFIGGSSQKDFSPLTFTSAMQILDPHDTFREMLLFKVNDIIIKTMLCMNSNLRKKYKLVHPADLFGDRCFQLLEFNMVVDREFRPWLTSVNIDLKARSREEQIVLELVYTDLLELVASSKEQQNIKVKTDNLNRIVRRNFDKQKFVDQYAKATEQHLASCSGRFVKIFPFVIEEEDLTEQLPVISPHHNIMIINKELSRILSPQNLKQFLNT